MTVDFYNKMSEMMNERAPTFEMSKEQREKHDEKISFNKAYLKEYKLDKLERIVIFPLEDVGLDVFIKDNTKKIKCQALF